MGELVDKLANGIHRIELSLRPERSVTAFKRAYDRGYLHVKFIDTLGGTELGLRLAPDATDVAQVDFDRGSGDAKLTGDLTLDYVKVRCHAKIDVATLTGIGWLERLPTD